MLKAIYKLVFSFVIAFIIIGIGDWVYPGIVEISTADIWSFHNTGIIDWLSLGFPLFIYGAINSIIISSYKRYKGFTLPNSRIELFIGGIGVSLYAGIIEEIEYRWLLFMLLFVTIPLSNFIFLGFAGIPLIEMFETYVVIPIANFTTFNQLSPWLVDKGWIFGTAIIGANGAFRKGHEYQGWYGYINSWFVGMFFFYAMLTQGLISAMVIHAIYDLIIFTFAALLFKKETVFEK